MASSETHVTSTEVLTALCDRCLGRRILGAQGAETQIPAGAERRKADGLPEVAEADCIVCEGAFADVDTWLQVATDALAEYEFDTFQAGTVFPRECEQTEKSIVLNPDLTDTIRTEANRILGPAIAEATGAEWQIDGRPDVAILVDTRFWSADVTPNSVFIAGRYTKTRRDVPQTHWPCKRCQGRGCWECDDAGVMYADSVEEAVEAHIVPAFQGASGSFHGAGREDIDALMLGTGRPFVIEVHQPKKRKVDLTAVEAAINAQSDTTGVGVTGLRMSDKEEVVRIKGADYQKEYLAHCLTESPVTAEQVQAAADSMQDTVLDQRTPARVAHRRADLVRNRTVHRITVEEAPDADGTRFSVRVLAESGTYIKEMVSGDDGRTTPSFSERLGVPVKVEFLDVVAILDE